MPGLLIKLRPNGPWRISPASGPGGPPSAVFSSDALFSALTIAIGQLGSMDQWLAANVHAAEPSVRLTSCFPFTGDTLLITPPRSLWPLPPSPRVRWKAARFVPAQAVQYLLNGERLRDEDWAVDVESESLLRIHRGQLPRGPFRVVTRTSLAVDRWSGTGSEPRSAQCLEFSPDAGLWCMAVFSSSAAARQWSPVLKAAFRLLADTGAGAMRSRGWGRAEQPEFRNGEFPNLLIHPPSLLPQATDGAEVTETAVPETAYWLISMYSPGAADQVDWSRGSYSVVDRGGRMEGGARKLVSKMITEGSVLLSETPLRGNAADVAPAGSAHSVYRSGLAVAIPIPWRVAA
ncbi:MAG: hypothetical protein HYZ37_16460 [Candidatus Solibacter usitatus]|nr:hypothetical protein [Candidatus Solibacter usitatus]